MKLSLGGSVASISSSSAPSASASASAAAAAAAADGSGGGESDSRRPTVTGLRVRMVRVGKARYRLLSTNVVTEVVDHHGRLPIRFDDASGLGRRRKEVRTSVSLVCTTRCRCVVAHFDWWIYRAVGRSVRPSVRWLPVCASTCCMACPATCSVSASIYSSSSGLSLCGVCDGHGHV